MSALSIPHRTLRGLACLLALAGCRDWPDYTGAFDVPHALAVLQPEVGGPFAEPVGFAANLHGGQIVPLALKQGRMLADTSTVAYLRGNPIPTGQQRILAGLAVIADGEQVTLYAADRRFQQIVELPYSDGVDAYGAPVRAAPTVSEPVFVDADGSGDTATLEALEIKTGWTSTEDWTVRCQGPEGWVVTGSRSGRQRDLARIDQPYIGVQRAVAFTLRGSCTPGDHFSFRTDSGLIEHPAGGVPLEVRAAPDQRAIAVVIQPEGGSTTLLKLLDPADPAAFAAAPALPVFNPGRLAWSADSERLFAADHSGGAWEIDVASGTARHLALPWPTLDVAHLDGEHGDRLFVAPLNSKEVWVVDLATGALVDVNPWVPGDQGIRLEAPVNGLEAMPLPYLYVEESDAGVRRFGRSVAVSVSSGRVLFASEADGCLVRDRLGPRTTAASQFGTGGDYSTNYSGDVPYGAYLERNAENSRHVLPNPCGGVTRAQSWSLRYDSLLQGWRVEGSLSGPQASVAYEDHRYVSDDGEVSFLIRAGGSPSREGWRMQFTMVDGLTNANGDNDQDNMRREVAFDQPGDPVFFHYRVGPSDQGWRPVDQRPFVLVAAQGSDTVARVMPQEGQLDASWE